VIRGSSTLVAIATVALALAGCAGGDIAPPVGQSIAPSADATTPPLQPGTYTTVSFQPAVTFTVPAGWVLETDTPLYATLHPAGNDLIGIHLFKDARAASQDSSCPASADASVGTTSSQLAKWISERPGLTVSTPAMATVGGLPGLSIDVAIRPDWTASCPFAGGQPAVPLLNSPAIDHWVVVGNEQLRLYLLDLVEGGTVIVDLDAFDGAQFETLLKASGGILRSMKFGAPAAASPVSAVPSPASAAPASASASTAP
jgi:hypothetical protein